MQTLQKKKKKGVCMTAYNKYKKNLFLFCAGVYPMNHHSDDEWKWKCVRQSDVFTFTLVCQFVVHPNRRTFLTYFILYVLIFGLCITCKPWGFTLADGFCWIWICVCSSVVEVAFREIYTLWQSKRNIHILWKRQRGGFPPNFARPTCGIFCYAVVTTNGIWFTTNRECSTRTWKPCGPECSVPLFQTVVHYFNILRIGWHSQRH